MPLLLPSGRLRLKPVSWCSFQLKLLAFHPCARVCRWALRGMVLRSAGLRLLAPSCRGGICPRRVDASASRPRLVGSAVGHERAPVEPRILARGRGYLFVDKPAGLRCAGRCGEREGHRRIGGGTVELAAAGDSGKEENSAKACKEDRGTLLEWLRREEGTDQPLWILGHPHMGTSGLVFVATSEAVAQEARCLAAAERIAELHFALVRGTLRLDDSIALSRRLCKPNEGSRQWRLAGRPIEGQEAGTRVMGRSHCSFGGEACTLVELEPVAGSMDHRHHQLRLHCVAAGHPIVGDDFYGVDRRLDWRFPTPPPAPRLMLHCAAIRVPLAGEVAEAVAPAPFLEFAEGLERSDATRGSPEAPFGTAFGEERPAVAGSWPWRSHGPWEAFAGGLSPQVLDQPHWDTFDVKRIRAAPFGPPRWDERARPRGRVARRREAA